MPAANPMIVEILAGGTTKEHLRVSHTAFQSLVSRCGPQQMWGWSLESEVRVFLFWLASGTSYHVVSVAFTMQRMTVFRVIEKMLQKIINIMREIVRLPALDSLPAVGEGFPRLAGSNIFRQCAGAIDGCHIRVLCPLDLYYQYINRKLCYTIQMQAIVDHTSKFVDIVAGYPGSVHDTRVSRNSAIFRHGLYAPVEYFIIGDSEYPCWREPVTIITHFKDPGITAEQRASNHVVSKARIMVEQSFGAMKTRWRSIFTKDLEMKLEEAVKVIAACSVMHNICISEGVIPLNENRRIPREPKQYS